MEYVKDNTIMNYYIIGNGFPVIMIHGWGMNSKLMENCLEPVFSKLNGFQRIYLNLPGMGKSKPGNIKNSDEMLDFLQSFIDEIIPNRKFLLIGESYGGYLSRGLVYKINDRISGLILLCPCMKPGVRKGKVEPLVVKEKNDEFLNSLNRDDYNSFTYINTILTKEVFDRFKKDVMVAFNEQDKFFLEHVLDGAISFDVDDLKTNYINPVLILTGRQDCEVGYLDQFDLFRKYENSSFVVLNRAGHNLQIEQPFMFNSIVEGWLADNIKEITK